MSELIAEARVLVTPDTTGFRSLLTTELAAATKGVTVPVQITPVAAGAASASRALAVERAAQANVERELAGASDASAAAASRTTEAARLEAAAAKQLAVAQEEVLGTTTALGTAQTQAARSAAALATARRAEAALTRADTAETAQNTVVTLANAEAQNTQAIAASRAAKAQVEHAAALASSSRGASSAALSFAGLRGATLAAGAPFLAGAAAVVAFGKSLSAFANFQTELNTFRVTAEATGVQMQQISTLAKDLGADLTLPGVSASDAAEALTELSKAGLSVEDSMDGARGALQLATAAGIDNQQAVELVANALNAFRLNGEDATRVADLLAAASKESQGSIQDMGLALRQSAAAAAQAGVSVEDTIALLTQLARAGLTASDAGTSLRVLLIRLINPTEKAQAALTKLNVTLRDQAGNLRPEVFSEIVAALSKLPKAQQDATLATIAGQDAFRALAITGRDGVTGLNAMRAATQEVGVAAEIAGARTQGLAGSAENLKNQISNASIALGSQLAPAVQGVTDVLSLAIEGASGLATKISDLRTQSEKPIRFVIDLVGAGDGGDGGFAKQITAFLTGTLPDQIEAATGNVTHLRDVFQEASADQKALVTQLELPKLIADLNKVGASASQFNELVLKLKELDKEMQNGSEDTAGFRQRFAEFITELQNLSQQPNIELPITIPPDLLDGLPELVDRSAKDAGAKFGPSFLPSLEESLKQGAEAAITGGLDPGVQGFLKTLRDEVSSAFLAIQPTVSAVIDVEFQGGSQEQVRAALTKELQKQEAFVAALEKKRAGGGQVSQARIDAAKQAATSTQKQIDAIDAAAAAESERKKNQRAADARAAETKRQNEQQAFEKSFLGQQTRSRQQQQNRITAAEQTAGLADDIAAQEGQLKLENDQIKAIRNSRLSEDAKKAAILALVTARIATTGAIKKLISADKQQRQEQRQQAQEALSAARLELGQATFDLTGNRSILVKAIDAEVKRQIALKNAAKKGSLAFIQAQTEIRNLLKRRKDLFDTIKQETDSADTTGGTTLVDLFNKAQDILGGAGNVGQTAQSLRDLSANTQIKAQVQQRLDIVNDPAKAAAARQVASTDRLIVAIDLLTQTLTGNTASGTPITRGERNSFKNLSQEQRFFYQKQARLMVEQGLTG